MVEDPDYGKILKAYLKHVYTCEGTSFLDWRFPGATDEEFAALKELERQAMAE